MRLRRVRTFLDCQLSIKRFAEATLAYNGELMDDYYLEDLRSFANMGLGINYMKSLDIYDRFAPAGEEE